MQTVGETLFRSIYGGHSGQRKCVQLKRCGHERYHNLNLTPNIMKHCKIFICSVLMSVSIVLNKNTVF